MQALTFLGYLAVFSVTSKIFKASIMRKIYQERKPIQLMENKRYSEIAKAQ